jgi:hypothetical protein
MTPAAAPTPIPAFALVNMLLGVLSGSAAADELVDGGGVDADVGVEDRSDNVVEDAEAEPNVGAMVYRGESSVSEQYLLSGP